MKIITFFVVTISGIFGIAMAADEAGWCQSKWGADDEIGAANLLSAAGVADAAKLVTEGKVYPLGIETNSATPAFPPRTFNITILQPGQAAGASLGPTKTTYNDDIINGWVGIGSQIDGLGHVGVEHVYYNCHRAEEFAAADGLTKLGIEKLPPLVAKGVVLDMTVIANADPVPAGTAFSRADIEAAMARQNVSIGEGDIVLFHTGWLSMIESDPATFSEGEPGIGLEAARFLVSLGVVAVGADTWGVEVIPFEEGAGVYEVHQTLIARNGVLILENMNTHDLVADGVSEFMFVLGQPRITGAVQAIINPVAIK